MLERNAMCRLLGALLLIAQTSVARQASPPESPAAKHAFAAKDWSALRSARAAAVSPDGTILYRVSFGAEKGPTHSEWWTVAPDGNHPVKLDLSDDFTPAGFTPNGASLFGLWKVNKQQQLAIFPLINHKAPAVPSTVVLLPRGIESVTASPDGKRFALVADPRPADSLEEVRHVIEAGESSLYVVNTDGTGGRWWCSNLKSVAREAAWSADSASLAVLSELPHIGYHKVSSAIDVCSAAGAQHVTDVPNSASGIAWADSGKAIAFLSTNSQVLTPEHVWTVPASGGAAEDRTPALQGTAVELAGDPHGRVWVLVARGVQTDLEEFRDAALKPAFRWPEGIVAGLPLQSPYAVGTSKQLAVSVDDPNHATNVAVPDGNHLRKIVQEGDAELKAVDLGSVRLVDWESKEGSKLQGIATFPSGYVSGKRYPFLVLPHGGPESNDLLAFDALARIIAGLGYVVLQPEYRGSTGYGTEFLKAIYQHFGDRAFRDVDSATDYAIAQGWADPKRLAIFGWSAGGFMTSWTVTQTSRYKAAIEGAGITDWSPFLWTSDVSQFDFDARWTDEDPEPFRRFSAVAYASKVTTPLLILHGEADQRVPTFQGVEYFQILAARGKTVRLVTYPGSPHFPVLWEQRLNLFEEITNWLRKYNQE